MDRDIYANSPRRPDSEHPVPLRSDAEGKVLTGTIGPNAERQWKIEKGTVDGTKVSFVVQQPDGPQRTLTLNLVKDRLQGEMLAEMNGQSFTAKVDAGRAPAK